MGEGGRMYLSYQLVLEHKSVAPKIKIFSLAKVSAKDCGTFATARETQNLNLGVRRSVLKLTDR